MARRLLMFLSSIVAASLALAAGAQEARKFAVLSLVGDSFMIVNHDATRAGEPPIIQRTVVDLPEHAFDNALGTDVAAAVRQAAPRASVVNLAGAKALYAHEGELLEDPRPLLARVQPTVASAGATHLVLVTKLLHRADVPLDAKAGEQSLIGLGFYLDPAAPTGNRDAPATAFLAPYAYFRVWLVDVSRQRVVGYRDVADISPVTSGPSSTPQVWQSLSSAEKVKMVHSLAKDGAQAAVRELVGNLPD